MGKQKKQSLNDATVRQKSNIITTCNNAILSIFGILFLAMGIRQGMHQQEGLILVLVGILLIVMGIVRVRMVRKLMHEIDQMDEETLADWHEQRNVEDDEKVYLGSLKITHPIRL